MHHYTLWDHVVASQLPFGDLALSTEATTPDVELIAEPTGPFWESLGPRQKAFELWGDETMVLEGWRVGDDWWWQYPDGTEFWIRGDGAEVRTRWPDAHEFRDTLTYFVGPVMGFLLRMRGIPCLHASTAVVDGRAVCFVGGITAGKSTISAEFARRGFELCGDDVAPIRLEDGVPHVLPSPPFVKLWSDSAAIFGAEAPLSPNWPKKYLALGREALARQPVPLGAIFLLGEPEGPVSPAHALSSMMQNVYVRYALQPHERQHDLELFGRLVETLPVRGLPPAESLDTISSRADSALRWLRGDG